MPRRKRAPAAAKEVRKVRRRRSRRAGRAFLLDPFDREIVKLLQENARMSYQSIARKLGTSEATVRRRVKQMVGSGAVSLTAIPDPASVGWHVLAFVGLHVQMGQMEDAIKRLESHKSVHTIASTTGRYDIILWVLLESMEHLHKFLNEDISGITGITASETFVVLNMRKRTLGRLEE